MFNFMKKKKLKEIQALLDKPNEKSLAESVSLSDSAIKRLAADITLAEKVALTLNNIYLCKAQSAHKDSTRVSKTVDYAFYWLK